MLKFKYTLKRKLGYRYYFYRYVTRIRRKYNIYKVIINDDNTIDVNDDVYLNNEGLIKLPLKFRKVSGDFDFNNNELTSLEGCPEFVGGDFDCSYNKITSLEGCPESVSGHFYCYGNQLSSLEGCPKSVGEDFRCDYIEEVKDYLTLFFWDDYKLDFNTYNKMKKREEFLNELLK